MKFGNGCWLLKEGIECFSPKEVYYVNKTESEVVICAPAQHIVNRGDTLGGVNLTVRITAPAEDVIRVQVSHYRGVRKRGPEFELNLNEEGFFHAAETEEEVTVVSGKLILRISKKNWSMRYERAAFPDHGNSDREAADHSAVPCHTELLTTSSGQDLAYIRTDWKGLAYYRFT